MDCRRYRILVLALLAGCAGCWRSNGGNIIRPATPNSHPPAVGQTQTLVPGAMETETTSGLVSFDSNKKKRKPNPNTYVKWAEVRETLAAAATESRVKQAYWDEARKGYQEALKLDADFVPALIGLGRVYSLLGEQERAAATFNGALQKAPKNSRLWYESGMSHAIFDAWPQAIQSFQNAVRFDPENRHYRKWLGLCLTRAGRVEEGLQVLTRVIGAKDAHYNVAGMLKEKGHLEQSRQHLQVALNIDPHYEKARSLLATLPPVQSSPTVQSVQSSPNVQPVQTPTVQPVVHFEPIPELPAP